ncbi:hypothetical protein [Neolewinella sp.]|uniref:hypothetical protein n=1 Tax=Neolewinella sp. TaxID=2993543 RepID=UPI003B52BA7E
MNYLYLLLPCLLLASCLDDELAFTVEASPVKADIVRLTDSPADVVAFAGTFTALDKDGILDVNVGIIATPVPNLELRVFSQTQDLLATVVTDAAGKTTLSLPAADLQAVSSLEWAGTYNGKAFRIITNL